MSTNIPAVPSCLTCGLVCVAARGWGRCPEAPFEVLAGRFGEFEKRFASLVKRANKLGCDAPSFEVLTLFSRINWATKDSGLEVQPRRSLGGTEVRVLRVAGKAPHLAGWSLVACLSPIEVPELGTVNMVRSVPGTGELPVVYRTSGTYCDHCQSDRRRKETYVVRHEDGRFAQVGSSCLSDFLGGMSPTTVAAMFTFWAEVAALGEDGEGGWGFGRGADTDSLEVYLGLVVREVRANGWLSRTVARERGQSATADEAMERLHPGIEAQRAGKRPELPTDDEIALARSALAWAREMTGTSDYEHNVKIVALTGAVKAKTAGIAASIWPAYERAMAREIERRANRASVAGSTYQGTVDSPIVVFVTITKVLDLESEYGVSHLHLMQDEQGNAYKWFASSERLNVGDFVKLAGRVKKHEEYNGICSTVLTRCAASDPHLGVASLTETMLKLVDLSSFAGLEVLDGGRVVRGSASVLRALRDAFMAHKKGVKAAQRVTEALVGVFERNVKAVEDDAA